MGDASVRAGRRRTGVPAVRARTRAYGLGGRARRAGDPAERARTTVTSRVRDAIARIDARASRIGPPQLQASVRTGTYCVYAPETPPYELRDGDQSHVVTRDPTPEG